MPDGTTDVTGHVRFIQAQPPALKSGSYTVTLSQTLGKVGTVPDLVRTFEVSGERWSLDPGEILAVYPPNLANGAFDGVLPHVVLGKHVLPWERTITPPYAQADAASASTWLAVLVFRSEEAPALRTDMRVRDLVPPGHPIEQLGTALDPASQGTLPAGTVSYPVLTHVAANGAIPLEWGETADDPCSVIDLPAALFHQAAPTAADMAYLAHIRKADTLGSEDAGDADTTCAVVLGNRVAGENAEAYAFLVSLMGMEDMLPKDGDPGPGPDAPAVRLVVFHAWRYFGNDRDETFRALAEGLNQDRTANPAGLTTLQVAPAPACTDPAVRNALAMGCVPLDHALRRGGNTVSWYRGPFAPYRVPVFLELVSQTPDALVRCDPATGLLDVTYAAAWQLGQLMALATPTFANGLYGWRAAQVRAAAAASAAQAQAATLGNSASLVRLAGSVAPPPATLPDALNTWLAGLVLLEGVTLSYLVPDERMLPPESIRFFRLDRNWVRALVDGAFSIGRAALEDLQHDLLGTPNAVLGPQRALVDGDRRITGFLLRSQLLAGWPRLVVTAYTGTGDDLTMPMVPPLRMERITPGVLLCLFDDDAGGEVKQVSIAEPPEHWHSGLERTGPAAPWTTTLRALADGNGLKAGEQMPSGTGTATMAVPMRGNGRTLCVARTASALQAATGAAVFTSAEFAIELNQGASAVLFPVTS